MEENRDARTIFLVWFADKITGQIPIKKEIGSAEFSGDCFINEPKCLAAIDREDRLATSETEMTMNRTKF